MLYDVTYNYYYCSRWWLVRGKLMVSYVYIFIEIFGGSTKKAKVVSWWLVITIVSFSDNNYMIIIHTHTYHSQHLPLHMIEWFLEMAVTIYLIVASLLYMVKMFYVWDNVMWWLVYCDFKFLSSATWGAMCMQINRSHGCLLALHKSCL